MSSSSSSSIIFSAFVRSELVESLFIIARKSYVMTLTLLKKISEKIRVSVHLNSFASYFVRNFCSDGM